MGTRKKEKAIAQFKRLTGVEKKTFQLMGKAVEAHDEKNVQKKGNQRSCPFLLSLEDQVLTTLMSYRGYRMQLHISFTYSISD